MTVVTEPTTSHEHDRTCTHTELYTRERSALEELKEYYEAGFTPEDIAIYAEDNPDLQRVLFVGQVYESLMAEIGGIGAQSSRNVREILRHNKTSLIKPTARHLADTVIEQLGNQPTVYEIQMAVCGVATGVALNRRSLTFAGNREPKHESRIINQFTSTLLANIDLTNVCGGYGNQFGTRRDEDSPAVQAARGIVDFFNQSYPQFDPMSVEFMISKIDFLMAELNATRYLNKMCDGIPQQEQTIENAELSRMNDALAAQIGRIRSYEIKPMQFPLGAEFGDKTAIYREQRDLFDALGLNSAVLSTSEDLAVFSIPTADNDKPFEPSSTAFDESLTTPGRRVQVNGFESTFVVTRDGELHAGISSGNAPVPLRDFFASRGKLAEYEMLRAKVLAQLFDATAPAEIVNYIAADDGATDTEPGHAAEDRDLAPDKVVYDMVVRRVRYMKQPMRKIKKEFKEAIDKERTAIEQHERHLRRHTVTGHLRRIPSGAAPSELAIENSKHAFGPEYELPDGYTFVKNHERGDESKGRVIGHHALQRTVEFDKR